MSDTALPPLGGLPPAPSGSPAPGQGGKAGNGRKILLAVICVAAVVAVVALGYLVGKPAFERWRAVEDARAALTGTWYTSDAWSEFTRETRIDYNEDGTLTWTSGGRVASGTWWLAYEDEGVWVHHSIDDLVFTGSDFSFPMPGSHGRQRVVNLGVDVATLESDGRNYELYSTEEAAQEAMVSELTGSDMETLSDAPSFGGEGATMGETTQKPSLETSAGSADVDIDELYGTWYVYGSSGLSSIDLRSDGYADLEDYESIWTRGIQAEGRVYGECNWNYGDVTSDSQPIPVKTLSLFGFMVRNTAPDGRDYSLGGSGNFGLNENFEVLSITDTQMDGFESRVMELQASDGSVMTMYSDANVAVIAGRGE